MDNIVFQAKELCYTYPGRATALDRLNLLVHAGEKVVILGANGTGKSTLLKLLAGLYFATSGVLLAFGWPLTEEALRDEQRAYTFRRRVGLAFQEPDVQLFSPTVRDEVAFGPLQMGLPAAEVAERVEEALHLLDIERLVDRPPYLLSGGEKKRVALASVLSLHPEVLLLDEPTASLDPRGQQVLVDFLKGPACRAKTMAIATNDLDMAGELADRLCLLDERHRLAAEGSPAEILTDRALLLRTNLVRQRRGVPTLVPR